MSHAVIVATARTPIGRAYKGSLTEVRPDDLSAHVIRAALAKVPKLEPASVEDIYWGCAQPAGEQGYNIARVAGLLAGLQDVPGATVNRYCSSSLQALRMAAHAIAAGEGDVFVTGGVECVSRFAKGKADGMDGTMNARFGEDLPNVYIAMGQTAENVAQSCKVSRREQDELAVLSQQRACAAQQSGFFAQEITPVTLPDGKLVDKDDCPRAGTTLEGLSALKPVFSERGTVTAGNACPLNDGAAAVVVMSEARAKELGVKPLARIVASGVSALDPELMGLGPVAASKRALARAGLSMRDIDLVEINEAFAAQVVPSAKQLEIPYEKLNVSGGAIALGHPFGMTGARIITTLLHNLQARDARYGLATMCVGGGQGMAMIVERL